jgi:hypothetical protein
VLEWEVIPPSFPRRMFFVIVFVKDEIFCQFNSERVAFCEWECRATEVVSRKLIEEKEQCQ